MSERTVSTRHGEIFVREVHEREDLPTIILLHGNSASGRVFDDLLEQESLSGLNILIPDFPGHGRSAHSPEPEKDYGMFQFRDVIIDLMQDHGASSYVVFGWSMGGHVVLELMDQPQVAGGMICGTPPVSMEMEDVISGFLQNDLGDLTYKAHFTDEEAYAYALAGVGKKELLTDQMVEDTKSCDGVFRGVLGKVLAEGHRNDHRAIAENNPKPLCVMNGEDDLLISAAFFSTLNYANPWRETPYIVKGAGHAPFLDEPEMTASLIADFAKGAGND